MKLLALAVGGKRAEMMPPADAERITGYRVGGISPFGHQRQISTVIDRAVLGQQVIHVNAGQRGLQVRMDAVDAAHAAQAIVKDIAQSDTRPD